MSARSRAADVRLALLGALFGAAAVHTLVSTEALASWTLLRWESTPAAPSTCAEARSRVWSVLARSRDPEEQLRLLRAVGASGGGWSPDETGGSYELTTRFGWERRGLIPPVATSWRVDVRGGPPVEVRVSQQPPVPLP